MYQLVLCTCPDQPSAELLARRLVDAHVAACVTILPGVTSVYEWHGEIETAQEHLLLIKSRKDLYTSIENLIKSVHSYQIPEIIAIGIEQGNAEYLEWVNSCTRTECKDSSSEV